LKRAYGSFNIEVVGPKVFVNNVINQVMDQISFKSKLNITPMNFSFKNGEF